MNNQSVKTEKSNPNEETVSFLRLERYALGELSSEQSRKIEADISHNQILCAQVRGIETIKSPLTWEKMRNRINAQTPIPASQTKGRPKVKSAFTLSGINDWLDKILPMPSKSALAWGGALVVLLLVIPAIIIPVTSETGFRNKGGSVPEIKIEIGEVYVAPGGSGHVQSGEVLNFSYRSTKTLYTQIWYIEDDGIPMLFDGGEYSSLKWPATSSWVKAPQRIKLEGNWKTQKILILSSPNEISQESAMKILSGDRKSHGKVNVYGYDLIQP